VIDMPRPTLSRAPAQRAARLVKQYDFARQARQIAAEFAKRLPGFCAPAQIVANRRQSQL
jgi:hypothetical protein